MLGGGFQPGGNMSMSALDLLKECANIRLIPLPPPNECRVCVEAYASGSQGEIQFAGPGPEHHFEASHKLVWLEQESTLQVQEKLNLVGQRPEITINGVPIELPKTIVGGPNIHILETPSVPPTLTISAVPSGDDGEIQFASGGHFPAPQNRFAGDNRLRWDDGRLEVTGEIVLNGEVLRKVEPAGSAGQIQFNAGGSPPEFGASGRLTWDDENQRLDVNGLIVCGDDSSIANVALAPRGSIIIETAPSDPSLLNTDPWTGILIWSPNTVGGQQISIGLNSTSAWMQGRAGLGYTCPLLLNPAGGDVYIGTPPGGSVTQFYGNVFGTRTRMVIDDEIATSGYFDVRTPVDGIDVSVTWNWAPMTNGDMFIGPQNTSAGPFVRAIYCSYQQHASEQAYVGINLPPGNPGPQYALDVNGTFGVTDPATTIPFFRITDQGRILISAPATYNQQAIVLESNGTEIGFLHENDSPFGIAGIACANDLRDNAFLYVAGSQIVADPPIAGNFNIVASKDIVFHTATVAPLSGERMRITSEGNVLVRENLDVAGNVTVNGNLYFSNTGGAIISSYTTLYMTSEVGNMSLQTVAGGTVIIYNHLSVGLNFTANGPIVANALPTSDPGAGSKQFWADPSDGYRVKWAV